MQIGIIGAGLMGTALGTVWTRAGHEVILSYARSEDRLRSAAQKANIAHTGTPQDAASAEVVLMAIPWKQLDDVLAQAGSLRGKVMLSCTMPMTEDDERLAVGLTTSGSEILAERTGARVISTFNTVWSDEIREARSSEDIRSMFYVGDDEAAKQIGERLIRDAGFDPVDVGGLENARLLEPFGLLIGKLGYAYDPHIAYRFMKP